jgi:Flp pilus assembly protein TadG
MSKLPLACPPVPIIRSHQVEFSAMVLSLIQSTLNRARARIRRLGRNDRGTAAIEFALIAPIMMVLMFGTYELSQVMTADRRITKISSSVGDLVARATSTTCVGVSNIMEIGNVLLQPFVTTNLSITVYNVRTLTDNATNLGIKWSAWNGIGSKAANPITTGGIPAGLFTAKKDDEVIITIVRYPFPWTIDAYVIGQTTDKSITLGETFYLKPRNGAVNLTSFTAGTFAQCVNGA